MACSRDIRKIFGLIDEAFCYLQLYVYIFMEKYAERFFETMRRYRMYVSTDYPATVHLGIVHLTHCDADLICMFKVAWYHTVAK
jgi:hypothetical protein